MHGLWQRVWTWSSTPSKKSPAARVEAAEAATTEWLVASDCGDGRRNDRRGCYQVDFDGRQGRVGSGPCCDKRKQVGCAVCAAHPLGTAGQRSLLLRQREHRGDGMRRAGSFTRRSRACTAFVPGGG